MRYNVTQILHRGSPYMDWLDKGAAAIKFWDLPSSIDILPTCISQGSLTAGMGSPRWRRCCLCFRGHSMRTATTQTRHVTCQVSSKRPTGGMDMRRGQGDFRKKKSPQRKLWRKGQHFPAHKTQQKTCQVLYEVRIYSLGRTKISSLRKRHNMKRIRHFFLFPWYSADLGALSLRRWHWHLKQKRDICSNWAHWEPDSLSWRRLFKGRKTGSGTPASRCIAVVWSSCPISGVNITACAPEVFSTSSGNVFGTYKISTFLLCFSKPSPKTRGQQDWDADSEGLNSSPHGRPWRDSQAGPRQQTHRGLMDTDPNTLRLNFLGLNCTDMTTWISTSQAQALLLCYWKRPAKQQVSQ